MSKFTRVISVVVLVCVLIAGSLFFVARTLTAEYIASAPPIVWGVTFSDSQAEYLGLDADEVYSALIHDLGARHIKLHVNWNATEARKGVLDLERLDRRIKEAEDHGVELIVVIGLKTGRWPECHTPDWFLETSDEEKTRAVIQYTRTIVGRYADSPAIRYWQIENEPFLQFGTCPDWYYDQGTSLVETSIAAVRTLDSTRPIIVSESGELSNWTSAAEIADIVGVTMYRSTWNQAEKTFGVNPYTFLAPEFYTTKAAYIKHRYGKPVISIELQAEPWASKPLMEASLEEQAESMNVNLFWENVAFAREAHLGAYYFWGAEWWYWMKTTHNQPELWEAATTLLTTEADT